MDLESNFAGCLCSLDVTELLVHDGRLLFVEDKLDGSPPVHHKSPLCALVQGRQESAPKSIMYVSEHVMGTPCPSRCKEIKLDTTVDRLSLRFGQGAWNLFAIDDEELRVVLFNEDDDDVTHGVVHRTECIALEDGEDGECVLCLSGDLEAVSDEFHCDLTDCTCDC